VKQSFQEPQARHHVIVHQPHVGSGRLQAELEASEELEVEGGRGVVERAAGRLRMKHKDKV